MVIQRRFCVSHMKGRNQANARTSLDENSSRQSKLRLIINGDKMSFSQLGGNQLKYLLDMT